VFSEQNIDISAQGCASAASWIGFLVRRWSMPEGIQPDFGFDMRIEPIIWGCVDAIPV
jgi:hypothetical protein